MELSREAVDSPPWRSVPPSRGYQHDLSPRSHQRHRKPASHLASKVYTYSHLIFFSLLGNLARIGLQALTFYPGAPVTFPILWANVAGCFIMGALVEDRSFFHYPLCLRSQEVELPEEEPTDPARAESGAQLELTPSIGDDQSPASSDQQGNVAYKAHMAAKKAIPLYLGLTIGFCGSCTSFAIVIRDMFLSASNDLPQTPPFAMTPPWPRSGGHSFLAVLAVLIVSVTLSYAAFVVGAHFAATVLRPVMLPLPFALMRNCLDPLAVVLGWGCWVAAILLAVFPPHDRWRGDVLFALVFAPVGCLLRFELSAWLNMRVPSFPVGTFVANILGTVLLGMGYDLMVAPVGGVLECQVLRGIEVGFCDSLTTLSSWIAEMAALGKRHAVTYGVVSVSTAFSLLTVIMGAMRWGHGFGAPLC